MRGIVVCPQPRAADVGADVLRRGGTAFDAALATAFCQMLQDPFMCGLGGMGVEVVRGPGMGAARGAGATLGEPEVNPVVARVEASGLLEGGPVAGVAGEGAELARAAYGLRAGEADEHEEEEDPPPPAEAHGNEVCR